MALITTRSGKGSPLTNAEVDANFTNLNDDKVETSAFSAFGTNLVAAADAIAGRTVLGLGSAALQNTNAFATAAQGTTADNALAKASNLSDLANAGTARTNLGLGTAAVQDVGYFATAAQGTLATNALAKASNLSDLANAGTARTNLGLGTAATNATGDFTLRAGDNLIGGFTATTADDGTKSSGTYKPAPSGGNWKKITNGGAFTLAAPDAAGVYNITVDVTNAAGAGAITFTGFATDYPKGDDLTTTNGHKFKIHISKSDVGVTGVVEALQ